MYPMKRAVDNDDSIPNLLTSEYYPKYNTWKKSQEKKKKTTITKNKTKKQHKSEFS